MVRWLTGCLVLTFLIASPCWTQDTKNKRIVGYLIAGGDIDSKLEQIALTKVTHLNLAFENPINDEGDLSFHQNNAKVIAHCKRIGIPVLISLCGGSASEKESMRLRYFQLIKEKHRSHFVKKLVDYVETHQIDGLDIDLEGPAINEDYDAFIAELAGPMHQKGRLLTCALSQGYGGARVADATLQLFDFVNVMAYDAAGPWNPKAPGQHSSLDFAKSCTRYWLGRGLPKSKLVLGVPFYGYGFGKDFSKGGYTYAKIVNQYPGAEGKDQVGDTIWYNGQGTMQAKVDWVRSEDLGGVMIWTLHQDVHDHRSLLKTIHEGLNAPR